MTLTRAGMQRQRERLQDLSDASLRALTGRAGLHRRGDELFEGGRPAPAAPMHLRPAGDTDFTSLRGICDATAVLMSFSDARLRARLRPDDPMAGAVFDLLEHLRVESLVPSDLPGARANIAARFDRWTEEFQGSDLAESALGTLIFAVTHAARSRILAIGIADELADQFELTRFSVAGDLGEPLSRLRGLRRDQEAFGRVARELAEAVSSMVHGALAEQPEGDGGSRELAGIFTFLGWEDQTEEEAARPAPSRSRNRAVPRSWYRIFDAGADRTTLAAQLFRPAVLHRLREQMTAAQREDRLNPRRIARRLENALAVPAPTRWSSDEEEGVVDGSRLARMIASPGSSRIFKAEESTPVADVSLTLLLDCSGSMRHHQLPVASAADLLGWACEAAEVPFEALGFTTRSWNGGAPYKQWKRSGSPAGAGRVAERQHLVIKPFDRAYRRSRSGFAALLRGDLYREGLDGEALDWACGRAEQQPARRRIVIVVSDGSPAESATAVANGEDYLGAHLRHEVDRWTATGEVEIAGLGLGLDLSTFYDRFQTVDVDRDGAAGILDGVLALCRARKVTP